MSTGERIERARALALAREFVEAVKPACERIEIAGSLRRCLPWIGDIEVLAVPRLRRAAHEEVRMDVE